MISIKKSTKRVAFMGREGLWIEQPIHQAINVADWKGDDEFEVYPEGARDKSLLNSAALSEHDFLIRTIDICLSILLRDILTNFGLK